MDTRCSESVATSGLRMHYHRCLFKGTVKRNGKWYCKKHDPVEIAKKREAKNRQWDRERAISNAVRKCRESKLKIADAAIEYINASNITSLAELNKAVIVYETALVNKKALQGVKEE